MLSRTPTQPPAYEEAESRSATSRLRIAPPQSIQLDELHITDSVIPRMALPARRSVFHFTIVPQVISRTHYTTECNHLQAHYISHSYSFSDRVVGRNIAQNIAQKAAANSRQSVRLGQMFRVSSGLGESHTLTLI